MSSSFCERITRADASVPACPDDEVDEIVVFGELHLERISDSAAILLCDGRRFTVFAARSRLYVRYEEDLR